MTKIDNGKLSKVIDLKKVSRNFKAALTAVKNMKDIYSEPLPGRKPSRAFFEALAVVKRGDAD